MLLGRAKHKLSAAIARWRFIPNIPVHKATNLIRLGSAYGGWTFEPSNDLIGSTIISAGLGEDASFDIEFARKFNARVVIVDPTPRAIKHFEEIEKRLGMNANRQYAEGGKQPATSYELSGVINEQLTLEPAALWINNDTLKFFSPKNPAHVSHSLVNLHNVGAPDAVYIEVPAITYAELVEKNSLKDVPLVKMDIEGAETVVITQMMNTGHRPRQLLIEYDELLRPSAEAKSSVEDCHQLLIKCGYRCRYYDGTSNFLYIHDLPQS